MFESGGFAMAALLVALTIMSIFLAMALPAWRTAAQREKETELIFRGQQYARAIALFQRKYANTFPPNLNILLDGHFLRKKYKDPMTADGEFQVVYANQQASAQPGGGGVVPTQGQQARAGLAGLSAAQPATAVGSGSSINVQGGIIGVASKSTANSIRIYNGHDKYNEWVFVALQASGRIGAPNSSQTPTGGINLPGGAGGRGGRGGQQPQGPDGRGNQPGGRGPGQGNQPPGPFGPRGGTGAPGQGGTPFGVPFGQGGFGGGRGR
jgi:type II secretory pathway pseudopilin PulG